ncbi:hypothetical protein ACFORO_25935 [Amycolatopsis halotolerans]|uniref:Uncharacterized protein n=1 Tax=Amycolatopsis halotolerans TaxID=330083 RepID=A0ABV7QNH8_9PSEU
MVANHPVERPGSADYIVNQLTALQQQAETQARQSKFPFVVSHDDPVLGRITDMQIVPNPSGSGGAVVSVFDGSGNLVLGTDPDAGYGLAQPQAQVPMYPTNPGLIFNSGNTFASYYTGQVQQNNSCFLAQWRMNNSWGGTGAASVVESYVKVFDSVTGWNWTSPTVTTGSSTTTAPGLLTTAGPYAVQVPEASIGHYFGIDIFTRVVSGGASSAIAVTPVTMIGCGYAFAQSWFGGTTSP